MHIEHGSLFISCVSDEFKEGRLSLAQDLTQLGLQAQIQEGFTGEGTTTLLDLDSKIQKCAAVVHIVGEMTGAFANAPSIEDFRKRYQHLFNENGLSKVQSLLFDDLAPNCSSFSYTQWEAYLAIFHEKPLFITVYNKVFGNVSKARSDSDQEKLQLEHLERLESLGHYPHRRKFSNIQELAIDAYAFSQNLDLGLPLDPPFYSIKRLTPASLLDPRHRAMRFWDFHNQREEFVRWTTSDELSVAKLLIGPGGSGKTRLMAELCNTLSMQSDYWHTGFLPSGSSFKSRLEEIKALIARRRDQKPLLIVVDSAEGRMHEVEQFLPAIIDANQRIRLVLLARSDSEWWSKARRKSKWLRDLASQDTVRMPTKLASQTRQRLFTDAVLSFNESRKRSNQQTLSDLPSKAMLDFINKHDAFNRPLFIQLAAMNYVSGQDVRDVGMEDMLSEAYKLEYEKWVDLIGKERSSQDEDIEKAIDRGVCQATLVCGTENREETRKLLLADTHHANREYPQLGISKVEGFLRLFLPRPNEGLAPLQPDILGEHFVARHLSGASEDLLSACLVWSGEQSSLRRTDVLRVINRSSQKEHGNVGEKAAGIIKRLVQSLSYTEPEYGYSKKDDMAKELVEVAISSEGALERILSEECGLPRSVFSALRHIAQELEIENGEEGLKTQEKEVALILGEICSRKLEGINVDDTEAKGAIALGRLAVFLLKNKYQESGALAVEAALSIAERLAEEDIFVHGKVTHDIVQVLGELGKLDKAEELAKRCQELLDNVREQYVSSNIIAKLQIISDRANLAQLQGQSGQAVAYRKKAAEVTEETSEIIGGEAPELILASKIDLSMALAENNQTEEAEELARRSTELIKQFPRAIDRSTALNALSAVHSISGNYTEALTTSRWALEEVSTTTDNSTPPEILQARVRARRSHSIDLWNGGQKEAARETEKKADDEDSKLFVFRKEKEQQRQQRNKQLYEERVRDVSISPPVTGESDHEDLPRIEAHSPSPKPRPIKGAELGAVPSLLRLSYDNSCSKKYKNTIVGSVGIHTDEELPTEVIVAIGRGATVHAILKSKPSDTPYCRITYGVDRKKLAFYLNVFSLEDTFPPGEYEIDYSVRYG